MPSQNQGVQILLVEDNQTDAELCIRALGKQNLANDLVWLKDGAEALDFLYCRGVYGERNSEDMPNLILLDLRMPKVDGMDVLRELKGDERMKAIPVIMLTSSTENPDLQECYRLGANSYVSKPVEFNAFADTVAKIGMYWLLINRPPQ
jgi:two-component system, response regulator